MTFKSQNLSTVAVLLGCICLSYAWNYQSGSSEGPSNWYHHYPFCGGQSQSPVNIGATTSDEKLPYFDFDSYITGNDVTMQLKNVGGHTAEVVLSGSPVYVDGGGLPGLYQLAQFHFHWGLTSTRGSEHTYQNLAFPMEMHLVHSKVGAKPDDSDALAVIAFFFRIQTEDNPNLNVIINNLSSITAPDSAVALTGLSIYNLLPDVESMRYARYHGSLTTPPCTESVVWSVVLDSIGISENQIAQFRTLLNNEGEPLGDNFRPTQPLNGRTISTTI